MVEDFGSDQASIGPASSRPSSVELPALVIAFRIGSYSVRERNLSKQNKVSGCLC